MALNKCETCGAMISSKFENCPNCGEKQDVLTVLPAVESGIAPEQADQTAKKEKSSVILNIISFLFPIVGWILYFALKSPVKAKACARWAWIGLAVNLITYLLLSKY